MLHQIINLFTHLPLSHLFWFCQLGCLAIWKPKGVMVSRKWLSNGFENNHDGAGFVTEIDHKLHCHKGFFKFDDFWKAFSPFHKYNSLIHFRIATHGKVETDNCHPFMMCSGKYALVHNGILPIRPPKGIEESDTAHFANNILSTMIERIPWELPQFTELVEEAIGIGNKIILLREDGKPWIFNESCGWWKHGAWFSNMSFMNVYGRSNYSSGWTGDCGWRGDGYTDSWGHHYNHTDLSTEERVVSKWLKDQDRKSKAYTSPPMIEC